MSRNSLRSSNHLDLPRGVYDSRGSSPSRSPSASPSPNLSPRSDSSRSTIETGKAEIFKQDGIKSINQYKIIQTIGRGSYGKVKLAKSSLDGNMYAIKIFDKTKLKKKRTFSKRGMTNEYENVQREIAILKKLDHPNVVRLFEVIDDPEAHKLYIVLEYMDLGGILPDQTVCDPLEKEQVWSYTRDIISALDYLHFHNVIHRDIKPSNILHDSQGNAKIADFGTSLLLKGDDDTVTNTAGSAAFMAPEICNPDVTDGYSAIKADIWATGITIFMFSTGTVPFLAPTIPMVYEKIVNEEVPTSKVQDSELRDLLEKMLDKNPANRITLQQIKHHNWITRDGTHPIRTLEDTERELSVSSKDIQNAFTLVNKVVMLVKLKRRLRKVRQDIALKRSISD